MKMESGQRKKTTTTTQRTANVVKSRANSKMKSSGGGVNGGRVTGINVVIKEPEMRSKDVEPIPKQLIGTWNSNSNSNSRENCHCNSDSNDSKCDCDLSQSPIPTPPNQDQVLKKTRSDPLPLPVSLKASESQLRKVKSDSCSTSNMITKSFEVEEGENAQDQAPSSCNIMKLNLTLCHSDHSNSILNKTQDDPDVEESTDNQVQPSNTPKHEKLIDTTTTPCSDSVNLGEGEKKKLTDFDAATDDKCAEKLDKCDDNDIIDKDNGGCDQLEKIKGLSKSKSKSKSTWTSTTDRLSSRSVPKAKPNQEASYDNDNDNDNDNDSKTPPVEEAELSHGKLETVVDLVMWRDVSKSAFIFGIGTFIIISSSYVNDFNFSLISVASYLSLLYLALIFLYKSFMTRGVIEEERQVLSDNENYLWGEDEAIWFVKLLLPYLNESLLKLRALFSGDPAITIKLAVVLFVLARCGSSITVWKMVKLGFFGVFVIPKFCSSYSSQITAYGNFWARRFQDAWETCSYKKSLAFAIFMLVWNFSSIVARAWAAFMLFVAFRYYQQSFISNDDFIAEPTRWHNVQIRQHLARQRRRVPTSLDQRKQKKSF